MKRLNKIQIESPNDLLNSIRKTFQPVKKAALCGIYFLFDGPELVYIGQARHIQLRIHTHHVETYKFFDSFAYYLCPATRLDALESFLIDACWPLRDNRNCHLKRENQWYSDAIRQQIFEDEGRWFVKLEYYDHGERGPATDLHCFDTYEQACLNRLDLARPIRQRQSHLCIETNQRRRAIREKFGGSTVRAQVRKILPDLEVAPQNKFHFKEICK